MPKIKKEKKNYFGRSDCIYTSGDIRIPNNLYGHTIGNNWIYHLSYCSPDSSINIKQNYRNIKLLHVTAIYNVHAQLGMEIQDDIRVHYGYSPQNLDLPPHFWSSRKWNENDLDKVANAQAIMKFIYNIFTQSQKVIE